MTIHVLVEGPSERTFLERWGERLLGKGSLRVHPHQGKGTLPTDLTAAPDARLRGLLDQLPAKLRGFANSSHPGAHRVVVLLDADDDNPIKLGERIADAARQVAPSVSVLVRVAVEETEAFYLGDLRGLERVFPEADMDRAREYVPDSVVGTWELFGQIVNDGGGNKVAWAEAMGPVLTTVPGRSRSPSFRDLVRGLLSLLPVRTKPTKRRYRHLSKTERKATRRRRG